MKKMIALRRHAYGVGYKEPGEHYDATAHEARTLVALGWAKYDTEPAVSSGEADPGPRVDEVDSTAVPDEAAAPEVAVEPPKATTKRKYERRDMKVKG